MTKTPQQIKNEVEKGCGKYIGTWKTSQKIICGCYTNMLELCPKCQAKLSILTEYDKSIKEIIEDLDISSEMINIMWNDNEDYPVPTREDINNVIKNAILSKIEGVKK